MGLFGIFRKTLPSSWERAIVAGDVGQVEALLRIGECTTNTVLSNGKPAIHHAVESDDCAVTGVLIDNSADIETRWKNCTPLYVAARRGNIHMVNRLLAASSDPNAVCGAQGQTSLYSAMEGYDIKIFSDVAKLREIVSTLIANGADYKYKLNTGLTLLHAAVACDDLDVVNTFLNLGLNVNALAGLTPPIAIAVRQGSPKVISHLVANGSITNIRFPNGVTLQSMAKRRNDPAIEEALSGPIRGGKNH